MQRPVFPLDPAGLARRLLRLARPGAYARADGAAAFEVLSPRNAFAAPIATIADADVTAALGLGWLTTAGADGHLQLSKNGRRALKRHVLSSGTAAAAAKLPGTGAAARSAAGVDAKAMPPQRIEGPLLWLRNRRDRSGRPLITEAQYEAGTRFVADYVQGQMQARVTASWSVTAPCLRSGTPGAGVDISDAALAARNRFHAAIAVVGPEMGGLLIDVCCFDIGLETAERARHWPVRSGKVVLDMGLTALARHYGLVSAAAEPQRTPSRAKPQRWADPAFTPTLAHWEVPAPAANRDADATASL